MNMIYVCPTEEFGTSGPLQLASVKCEEGVDVCFFSFIAVFNVILTAMCIYVIYKCLSWDFDQQEDLCKPS